MTPTTTPPTPAPAPALVDLHRAGHLSDHGAALYALVGTGWTPEDAQALLDRLTAPPQASARSRAAWSRWTSEDENALRALHASGMPDAEVAAMTGRTVGQVRGRLSRLRGDYVQACRTWNQHPAPASAWRADGCPTGPWLLQP